MIHNVSAFVDDGQRVKVHTRRADAQDSWPIRLQVGPDSESIDLYMSTAKAVEIREALLAADPVPAGTTRVDGLHLTHVVTRRLDILVERTGRTHTDLINAAIVIAARAAHSAELARQLVAWPASPCAAGCVDPAAHAEGGHDA